MYVAGQANLGHSARSNLFGDLVVFGRDVLVGVGETSDVVHSSVVKFGWVVGTVGRFVGDVLLRAGGSTGCCLGLRCS